MARRHWQQLRVGNELVTVETLPEPPAGYTVKVWRSEVGLAPKLIFDKCLPTTAEASQLFRKKCHEMVDSFDGETQTGVPMNRRPLIRIEEEE